MLPKRKRNIRYNPRYGRQENYDIPASLQRKPYAYTQVSPEVRRQEEKEAKKAKEKPVCPHCGEQYDLTSGTAAPQKGLAREPMKRLNIQNADGKLTLSQR